jgi:glycosyltransferase involved in cell wall biosynthesis
MRASLVIAAHNEGELLARTVESCVESCDKLDCELVVVDDASADDSVAQVEARFPAARILVNEQRMGASAAKARGADEARGEVLVFLDGHSKPAGDAIVRLVEDVEALQGAAIITPAVANLEAARWRIQLDQVGHGYALDLLTLESHWIGLDEMVEGRRVSGRALFESPALIGCALAVTRELYSRLWGFDRRMRCWGVEDLDLGLKCWLLGSSILHDPGIVVGHRFRTSFDNYTIPAGDILYNQLRLARKHFTHTAWSVWVNACRQRNPGSDSGHPEGFWAYAWNRLEHERASVEQERLYLLSRRTRDEFWYAERFGLGWPRLAGDARMEAADWLLPISSVGPSPSPSPPPGCRVSAVNPAHPVLVVGATQTFRALGSNLSAVGWTTNPNGTPASGTGAAFATKWTSPGNKQVVASCAGTSAVATAVVVSVSGVLTPRDNFAGRSRARFGVGEIIDLSFTATPNVTSAQLGGLRWFISSGGGVLTGTAGNDGRGVYTAPAAGGAVRLVLRSVATGSVVATRNITVVEPNDGLMIQMPGTNLRHTNGLYGVGFKGSIFLRPTDVSFSQILMGEGTVAGVGTGYLAPLNGIVHPVGALVTVGTGNSANGCQANGTDTVDSGDRPPPFSVGDFLWAIPWQFSVAGSARQTFTTANHHMTADAAGTATIAKKGAGPFSRAVGDPTSTF